MRNINIVLIALTLFVLIVWITVVILTNIVHYYDRDLCFTSKGHKIFLVVPCLNFFNPSDYVAEPTAEFLADKEVIPNPEIYSDKFDYCKKHNSVYCQMRKKTPEELMIDYCSQHTKVSSYFNADTFFDSEECACDEWLFKKEEMIDCKNYSNYNFIVCNLLNVMAIENNYHISKFNICLESRPKTECEKGNKD
mgnify:CR=1 FL=1